MQPEYLLTPQILPDGGSQNLMLDFIGNLRVTLAGTYNRISTATTTTVKSGAGVLNSITINTTSIGSITVYDSLSASGNIIAVFPASATMGTYTYNVNFTIGLTIVTAGASDLTVSFR